MPDLSDQWSLLSTVGSSPKDVSLFINRYGAQYFPILVNHIQLRIDVLFL
jgi:hypothetical protein